MSRIPILGSEQLDARFDGAPPRLRTRSLWCWRARDGLLAPLNERMSVAYRGRSSAATIHASNGTSGTLAASAPAFTSVDWDGDGVREEDALQLSDEEALRYYDATTERLVWTMAAKVLRLDWIELGTAGVSDAPYWSFTTDEIDGAYLAILGSGTGDVQLHHYNGTSTVVSELPVTTGNKCSLRAQYFADGAVQIGLVRNGGAEVLSTKSAALTPAAVWGDGGDTMVRVNEIGDGIRGELQLRHGAVYGGVATRRELLEVI